MTSRMIDRFFRILAREFGRPATIILTGAAAGALLGHVRPSRDIDFGVRLRRRSPRDQEAFQAAVERTVRQTRIQTNYAEDIDRWSSISLLDYRRHTAIHRRFGTLEVRLLDPAYWSIGKLGRYYDLDAHDLVAVLKRRRVPLGRLLTIWAKALRASPLSSAVFQFRMHAEHFLHVHGRAIWGRTFNSERAVTRFHRLARIHPGPKAGRRNRRH